jgi:hypothetical protein
MQIGIVMGWKDLRGFLIDGISKNNISLWDDLMGWEEMGKS